MHHTLLLTLDICLPHQLVFVKPDFRKYEAASAATREMFKVYDPHFVAGSLDEAYLDVTDYCAAHSMTGEQVRT